MKSQSRPLFFAGAFFLSLLLIALLSEGFLRLAPTPFKKNHERLAYLRERHILQSQFGQPDPNPLKGWRHTPGAQGVFENKEFRTQVRFNSLGLRGPEIKPPDPKQTRVLVLGDSFTVGWGVEEEETFVHRLNQAFPSVYFINAGVSGYGTRSEWGLLEELGPSLKPQKLLLVYYHNDAIESAFPDSYKKPNPQPYKGWDRWYGVHFLKGFDISALWQKPPPYYRGSNSNIWEKGASYLDKIRDWCQVHQVPLAVAYLPVRDELGESNPLGYRKRVVDYCQKHSLSFIDLTPVLQSLANPEKAYFQIDEHLTAAGHRVVAQALTSFIKKGFVVPENSN